MDNNNHAYLIMAHHRPDLLNYLLAAIDDERNDVYLHIDSKSDMQLNQFSMSRARLFVIDSMNVNWAGYTQVECEYRLLKVAYKNEPYLYYHFITGATFPLKSQKEMHDFFNQHQGTEFIGFDEKCDYSDRVRYRYLFCESGKLNGLIGKIKNAIRLVFILLQKMVRYDRTEYFPMVIKKGLAYWSVTNDFVKYVLDQENLINKMLKYSISGDEIFIQTLAYNSEFRDKIYDYNNEYRGGMREFAWESCIEGNHPWCNFGMADKDYLLKSEKCFALKFESPDGIDLIKLIGKEKGIL